MKSSAGILLVRKTHRWEFFLLHTGGPFWANKDRNAWSFPKGELDPEEEPLDAAKREWAEETGLPLPPDPYWPLPLVSNRYKQVWTYLAMGDADPLNLCSNMYEEEWPKGSGILKKFPEADRAAWFSLEQATFKIHRYLEPVLSNALQIISQQPFP